MNQTSRAFVGTRIGPRRAEQSILFALRFARAATLVRFAIQHLRRASRAAFLAQREHLDYHAFLATRNLDALATAHELGGFAGDVTDADLASFNGLLGERTGLEKTRGP